jgi:hypothetical protein
MVLHELFRYLLCLHAIVAALDISSEGNDPRLSDFDGVG